MHDTRADLTPEETQTAHQEVKHNSSPRVFSEGNEGNSKLAYLLY